MYFLRYFYYYCFTPENVIIEIIQNRGFSPGLRILFTSKWVNYTESIYF